MASGPCYLAFHGSPNCGIDQNRDHIVNESGFGREHFSQATAVVLMTGLQYVFYTGSLGFPETMSMALGITGALSALWMINVLE